MTTMVYPAYDAFNRHSGSRRQSLAYGATPMGYHYRDQHFADPMLPPLVAGEYPQPSYQIYGPTPGTVPMDHRLSLTGPSYDDIAIRDSYYPDERQLSSGPMPPMVSQSLSRSRLRRHSTVSFAPLPPPMDAFRRPSSIHIKFKRKGSFTGGISLGEAQSHVRLSGNDLYTLHDFHADRRGRILLRIRWTGYASLTYEIPLDTYDGRVSLQTLARRVSRACAHYLQANVIPIPWNHVELHHLEEVRMGVWQPMLSTR